MIAVNFTETFRNICSVIDNHIEFSSLPFDIIENYLYKKYISSMETNCEVGMNCVSVTYAWPTQVIATVPWLKVSGVNGIYACILNF